MDTQELPANCCPHCHQKNALIGKYARIVGLLRPRKGVDDSSPSPLTESTQENSAVAFPRGPALLALWLSLEARRLRDAFEAIGTKVATEDYCMGNQQRGKTQRLLPSPKKQVQRTQELWPMACQKSNSNYLGVPQSPFRANSQGFPQTAKSKNTNGPTALHKEIFCLRVRNKKLESENSELARKISDNARWMEKETDKKRASLQGLAQELAEKNELIEELRLTIRGLEFGNASGCVLEEGVEELAKEVRRLQSVKERVACQHEKVCAERDQLKSELDTIKKQRSDLQTELVTFKKDTVDQCETMKNMSQKMSELQAQKNRLKACRARLFKKEHSISAKLRGQSKPDSPSSSQGGLSCEAERLTDKLETLFTYLYTLEEKADLPDSHLFDPQETAVLKTHRERVLCARRLDLEASIPLASRHQLGETATDGFGVSVLQAFDQRETMAVRVAEPVDTGSKLKMMELESQNGRLLGKVSTLSQQRLYVRSILLNLLRSLELKSMRREAEDILNMLCDFFEYSEEQREAMMPKNTKKLFGFI